MERGQIMSKVAVVTGASKGIGAATAVAFGKAGYDVVINYLSDEGGARETARQIESAGQKATLVQADVFTERGVKRLFRAAAESHGTIDVLVNNAGKPKEPPFGEWTAAAITKSLSENFTAAALCTQAAVPLMVSGGSVLFVSSIYGLQFGGNPHIPLYSAGKAAIINFVQAMAEVLAPKSIRCNAVAPGMTKTPAVEALRPEYIEANVDMTLQKELMNPDDIANALVFLAQAPHITAQTIVVDGGWQKKIRTSNPRRK
jgi:NAD(P)-dependent dehydrogenase (short-subunit alcohol dehydrogenase family)